MNIQPDEYLIPITQQYYCTMNGGHSNQAVRVPSPMPNKEDKTIREEAPDRIYYSNYNTYYNESHQHQPKEQILPPFPKPQQTSLPGTGYLKPTKEKNPVPINQQQLTETMDGLYQGSYYYEDGDLVHEQRETIPRSSNEKREKQKPNRDINELKLHAALSWLFSVIIMMIAAGVLVYLVVTPPDADDDRYRHPENVTNWSAKSKLSKIQKRLDDIEQLIRNKSQKGKIKLKAINSRLRNILYAHPDIQSLNSTSS